MKHKGTITDTDNGVVQAKLMLDMSALSDLVGASEVPFQRLDEEVGLSPAAMEGLLNARYCKIGDSSQTYRRVFDYTCWETAFYTYLCITIGEGQETYRLNYDKQGDMWTITEE